MEPMTEHLESTRTAAAVLCLLEGSDAPVQELLSGMATAERLEETLNRGEALCSG